MNRICNAHTSGVPIGAPAFYSKGCSECEKKLAAGKVEATDPPLAHGWRRIRNNAPRIDWEARAVAFKAKAKRQRELRRELPPVYTNTEIPTGIESAWGAGANASMPRPRRK